MNDVAKWCTLYLVNSVWQLALLTGITAAAIRLAARIGSKTQYRLWMSCLFLSLVLPVLSASLGMIESTALPSHSRPDDINRWKTPHTVDRGPLTMRFTEIPAQTPKSNSARIALGLYLLSLLGGTVRLVRRLLVTRDLVARASRANPDRVLQRLLDRLQHHYRIPKVEIRVSLVLNGPATVSWASPMLIVPSTFANASEEAMTAVLAHELAHVRRRDFEINLVLELLAVFVFYHPLSHWIKKRISESRETVCDEMAVIATGRTVYTSTLLELAELAYKNREARTLSLGIFETTNLERRIMNLVNARPPLPPKRRMFLTAACWLGFFACSVGAVVFGLHPSTVHAAGSPEFLYDPTQTFDAITPKASRKQASDFTLVDNNGKAITLSDYKGKVVLLDFWATWCGGCKLEIPWYIEFDKKYRDQGLAVIGVSMDEDGWKAVRPFLAKKRDAETGGMIAMEYPIVIGNNSLAARFGLTSMPMTLLIDRDGKVAVSHTGVVDKDNFEANIRELLR